MPLQRLFFNKVTRITIRILNLLSFSWLIVAILIFLDACCLFEMEEALRSSRVIEMQSNRGFAFDRQGMLLNLLIFSPFIPLNIFAICYEVSRRDSRLAVLWPLVILVLNVLLAWYLFAQSAILVDVTA